MISTILNENDNSHENVCTFINRKKRIQIYRFAAIRIEGRLQDCSILNVSQSGIALRFSIPIDLEMNQKYSITMYLQNKVEINTTIIPVRKNKKFYGCSIQIGFEELEQYILDKSELESSEAA